MSVERLQSKVIRLEVALRVRAVLHVPMVRLADMSDADKRAGRRSAHRSGYEVGWRGHPLAELYTQDWMQMSYARGWAAGFRDSEQAIRELVELREKALREKLLRERAELTAYEC